MKRFLYHGIVSVLLFSLTAMAQDVFKAHVNQIGFGADAQKQAVYVGTPTGQITIKSVDGGTINYIIPPGTVKTWAHSGDPSPAGNRVLDFSTVTAPGHYALFEGNNQISPVFQIGVSYDILLKDALRFYYHHRASSAIVEPYAEGWARAAGHTNSLLATVYNDAGTATSATIASHRGWYDAGDYGRYIVNSGISTYTLLMLYEKHADKIPELNIPEDDEINGLPQLLSEIKWNLDWMLTMQAADGGVHHKMTEMSFGGTDDTPAQASLTPHAVQGKTTAATLNFAGVMAAASRIYRPFDAAYADKMLAAAQSAWSWSVANPARYYGCAGQCAAGPIAGNVMDPTSTGPYDDMDVRDEFYFAAAALATVVSDPAMLTQFNARISEALNKTPAERASGNWWFHAGVPFWRNPGSLGTLEIINNPDKFPAHLQTAKNELLGNMNWYLGEQAGDNGYGLPFADIFYWGSNSVAANWGIIYLEGYNLTGDIKFKNAAQAILDYLLGRNPLGQSYVTGFGHKPAKNSHDRLSASYGMRSPGHPDGKGPVTAIPGQLVGGPANTGCFGDQSPQFTTALATRYDDNFDCFGYNEITINWNAPLAFLLAALGEKSGEDIVKLDKKDVAINPHNEGGIWYALTIGNTEIGNSKDANDNYEIINAEGNAVLYGINASQDGWGDFSSAVIGLKTENSDRKTFDLSKCTNGFSYRYKGHDHRLTLEIPDPNGQITFYGNTGNGDGRVIANHDEWRTQVITGFTRDPHDANPNTNPTTVDFSKVADIFWMIRAFGGQPDVGADGEWTLTDGYLEIADCICLGVPAMDLSNVPSTAAVLPGTNTNSIASTDRVVKPSNPAVDGADVSCGALSAQFTAGPNPVAKSAGTVIFFWQGKEIKNTVLSIYDASGNLVNKVSVSDKTTGKSERRRVGSWNLKDSKGRAVSEGTYVVKGTIKTGGGNRERVSLMIGVK